MRWECSTCTWIARGTNPLYSLAGPTPCIARGTNPLSATWQVGALHVRVDSMHAQLARMEGVMGAIAAKMGVASNEPPRHFLHKV